MRQGKPLMSFVQSLPADKRALAWVPHGCCTLTLRLPDGTWTAFQAWRSVTTEEEACNVTIYQRAPGDL
jgi:hypothetical protein